MNVELFLERSREKLWDCLDPAGHWEGRLSGSALATATALGASHTVNRQSGGTEQDHGVRWLCETVNADGGWGDTPESKSNLSTTVLCRAVLAAVTDTDSSAARAVGGADDWIERHAGGTRPDDLYAAVTRRYGQDRTFAAPILAMTALMGGLAADGDDGWGWVPQLPCELAVLPAGLFRWLNLQVVSYALPALIAIGLLRHKQRRCGGLRARWRDRLERRCLERLQRIQPDNGGFLEAVPLTAFVVMSLAGAGHGGHPVVEKGLAFILARRREDGSWPIDTDLATWVTTQAINALGTAPGAGEGLTPARRETLLDFVLRQQHRHVHPFTRSRPGGWAWTPNPGGVPDADDTASSLLALRRLAGADAKCGQAAEAGVRWLLKLQNRDGGWPTFCRGWGKLPFDRSCPDISAHVLRAFSEWRGRMPSSLFRRMVSAERRGFRFLAASQEESGAWCPLWFGNQAAPGECNRTIGTAQVIDVLHSLGGSPESAAQRMCRRGVAWLIGVQNEEGGFGGDRGIAPTIEETGLAVRALAGGGEQARAAAMQGAEWLCKTTAGGESFFASPVGLYFSRLWYAEAMYPVVFTVAALARIRENDADGRDSKSGEDG